MNDVGHSGGPIPLAQYRWPNTAGPIPLAQYRWPSTAGPVRLADLFGRVLNSLVDVFGAHIEFLGDVLVRL